MNFKLLTLILIAGSSAFAESHWSVRLNVGGYGPAYYAPPPVAVVEYPVGPRYTWTTGYWTRRPYPGAYWVAPRYYQHRYYRGYWGRHERWEREQWRRHEAYEHGFRNRY